MELFMEWLPIIMFAGFFLLLASGFPVAFSFVGTGIVFGLIGYSLGVFDLARLNAIQSRWFNTMSDFTLLAIPFFIFLGAILEKSGLAEELLETVGILLGPVRGGIALAVIVVGTILAATTGVVAATVIAMGLISLPMMVRLGYDKRLATGVITASGTLAQMIPPSLVLVVLSDQIGVSVGKLFAGALVPGLMLAGGYLLYTLIIAYAKPHLAPPLPLEMRQITGRALFLKVLRAMVPPVVLILSVLGTIFGGLATPTEAGAVGAVGVTILAALNGRFNLKLIWDASLSTARTTALVIMILFCSTFFAMVFDGLGGSAFFKDLLVNLSGNNIYMFLLVANIVVFLLGVPLEFVEICFIVMPLFVPAALALGFTEEMMVWFGVVMAINLQTAFISPPVGFSLFYLQSVKPDDVKTSDIHMGAWPFVAIQVAVLLIVIAFPDTVLWLVRATGLD
jgi:tripartite ATP-independent transporter DctM subunit